MGGTREWLAWCEPAVLRFVYFSSIKAVPIAVAGPTDESMQGPYASAYGASKWRSENAVAECAAADSRRSALILRCAVTYGPGSTANIAAMVAAVRRRLFF